MRSKLSLAGLILVLVVVNLMIAGKETALARGQSIFLELVPVDPRSLMQGDYMVLRYALAEKVPQNDDAGVVYVKLDSRKVATSLAATAADGTLPLRYRRKNGEVVFDAESYFFQEGKGHLFQEARFAELRVDSRGMPILVALLDENLVPIRP